MTPNEADFDAQLQGLFPGTRYNGGPVLKGPMSLFRFGKRGGQQMASSDKRGQDYLRFGKKADYLRFGKRADYLRDHSYMTSSKC